MKLATSRAIPLVFIASLIFYGAVVVISPLRMGNDSAFYIQFAQDIAGGDLSRIRNWPLQWAYPAALAIGYALAPDHFFEYIKILSVFTASLIPVIYYAIARLTSHKGKANIMLAMLMILYPYTVFWTRYVLTDVLFLSLLLLNILTVLRVIQDRTMLNWVILFLSFSMLLVARPSSLPAIVIGVAYIASQLCGRRGVAAFSVSIVLIVGVVLSIPSFTTRLLAFRTVYQSLWLSTRLSTNNIDERRAVLSFDNDVPSGMSEGEYKLSVFREFVTNEPVEWAKMSVQRAVAYWYPWIWGRWSVTHKLLDALISATLTVVAVYALLNTKVGKPKKYFILLAVGFSLLSVFTQVDSDGRYRLPAEMALLLLLPMVLPHWYYRAIGRRAYAAIGLRGPNGS